MAHMSRLYDVGFNEPVVDESILANGVRVRLRLLGTHDKAALSRGFERLSPESRYRRFLTPKKHLTADELRFFTELDGVNHLAVAALELSDDGREGDIVGVARCIRIHGETDVAEVAIAVIDELQSLGLGRLLLERLACVASARGINHFRFYFLSDNNQIRGLVKRLCWNVKLSSDGQLIAAECPISGPDAVQDDTLELLDLVAKGSVIAKGSVVVATPLALSFISADIWWREIKRTLTLKTIPTRDD